MSLAILSGSVARPSRISAIQSSRPPGGRPGIVAGALVAGSAWASVPVWGGVSVRVSPAQARSVAPRRRAGIRRAVVIGRLLRVEACLHGAPRMDGAVGGAATVRRGDRGVQWCDGRAGGARRHRAGAGRARARTGAALPGEPAFDGAEGGEAG